MEQILYHGNRKWSLSISVRFYLRRSNTYKANNYILCRFSISCRRLVVTYVKFTNSCLRHTIRHVRDNMPHLWIDNSVTGEDYQLSSVGPANLIKAPRPSPESRHFANDILICNSFDKYFGLSPFVQPAKLVIGLPLVEIMTWRRTGENPLCQPMMI